MSTITIEVRQDGYDHWYRYASVELDTEDYDNIDEMTDAAYYLVQEGDVECGDKEYGDEEVSDTEVTDNDYDADEEYKWRDSEAVTVNVPTESSIEW